MPRIISGARAPWSASSGRLRALSSAYPPPVELSEPLSAPWAQASAVSARHVAPWVVMSPRDFVSAIPWAQAGAILLQRGRLPWLVTSPADREAALPWGRFEARPAATVAPSWVAALRTDRLAVLPWGVYARLLPRWRLAFDGSSARNPRWVLPWTRYSRPLPVGWGIPTEPGEQPGDNGGIVPTLRSYVVANSVTLVRVSDATAIPAESLSIDCDVDSWTLGWSASVQGSALALVEPPGAGAPVELEAVVNGEIFRLLVEQIARDRRFPTSRLSLSGRGLAAALADPYAAVVSRDNTAGALTANQLAEQALEINGVPIGWTVDWGLTDWLVPAGAWAHRGTHIEAVQAIAAAAGGTVRGDRALQALVIRPRWPVLPWDLAGATPDLTLPDAAVARESIRWVERPDYNGVYVSGEAQGILAHVRRTGTLGDLLAPMVTDALITHDDAARQRGPVEIGIPGRSAILSLELQVLPTTGVVELGTILQFTDGAAPRIGIVRAVSVSYRHPVLRQTVEVECHA